MMAWALARTPRGTLVVTPLRSLHAGGIPLELISRHETMVEAWAALQERRNAISVREKMAAGSVSPNGRGAE